SPILLAALFASGTVPQLVLLLVSGWLSDRWNPIKVLLVSDTVYLLGTCFVAFAALTDRLSLAWLAPPLAIMGAMGGLYHPARTAIIPRLAGDTLAQANQFMVLAERLSTILGPLFSGAMFVVLGVGGIYVVNAATFFITILTVLVVWRLRPQSALTVSPTGARLSFFRLLGTLPLPRFLITLSFFAAGA